MRKIFTFDRLSMIQDRFSSPATLNIEIYISNAINTQNILEIYTQQDRHLILGL